MLSVGNDLVSLFNDWNEFRPGELVNNALVHSLLAGVQLGVEQALLYHSDRYTNTNMHKYKHTNTVCKYCVTFTFDFLPPNTMNNRVCFFFNFPT